MSTTNITAALVLQIRALGTSAIKDVAKQLGAVEKQATAFSKAMAFAGNANQAAEGMGRLQGQIQNLWEKPFRDFVAFDKAMAGVSSKMDVLSSRDFARLKKAAQESGAEVGFSSVQAAGGLEELAASGLSVEQQMAALPSVLKLASGGQVEVGRAAAIAVNTMAQFGIKASEVGRIGDVLLGASNASTIGLNEVAETLKYVGPVASAAGLSLESTAKFTALLGNSGIEASQAGTALRGMLAAMAAPSGKAKKALSSVSLSAKDLENGVKDPIGMLGRLSKAFESKGFNQAQKLGVLMKVFGREVAPAVQAIMDGSSKVGEDGTTGWEKMSKAIDNSAGALDRANDVMQNTASAKLAKLRASLDKTSTELGEKFSPTVLALGEDLQKVAIATGAWAGENPQLVTGLGRIAIGMTAILAVSKTVMLAVGSGSLLWSGIARGANMAATGINGTAAAITKIGTQAGLSAKSIGIFNTAMGVGMAAAGGYAFGTLLDEWIGKLFELRGGLLSTEAALKMGEATGDSGSRIRDAEDPLDKPEFDSLRDKQNANLDAFLSAIIPGYAGNLKRNKDEAAAAKPRLGVGGGVLSGEGEVTPATGAFNAVTGTIEIEITDGRPKVKVGAKGPVNIRVGQSPVGTR